MTMTKNTDIVRRTTGDTRVTVGADLERAKQASVSLSKSDLVPEAFRHKPANCFVAVLMAHRLGYDPFTLMQEMHVIHGKAGFSARFKLAMAEKAGVFRGPITYRRSGEDGKPATYAVTARAVLAATGDVVEETVSMEMAAAEGWTKNTKYKTMPWRMLQWRAGSWLCDTYAPGVLLGFRDTVEEIVDIAAAEMAEAEATVRDASPTAEINAALAGDPPPENPEPTPEQGKRIEDLFDVDTDAEIEAD